MDTNYENPSIEQTGFTLDQPNSSNLEIGEETQKDLRETKQWANFLAILGFIFVGLIVVVAFSISTILSNFGGSQFDTFPTSFLAIFYILIAVLYFFPILYLYKFASNMGKALRNKGQLELNAAFKNLKAHYRFIGILMVIVLSFYVIMIVIGLTIGLSGL